MATTIANDASQEASFLNKRNLWLVIAGFTLFYLWVRWYQHVYGWSAGLDAFAPEVALEEGEAPVRPLI